MKTLKIKIALSCVILLLLFLLIRSCRESSSLLTANVLLKKDLTKTVNSKGEETAKIEALKVENKSLLKDLRISGAVNENLREKLRRNTHAGFNAKTVTKINTVTRTDSIYLIDSLYPVYMASDSTKWISYTFVAGKDSVRLEHLKIVNEITGVFNEEKKLFKKDKIKFELTNHNPYTTTSEMQSFIYKPKPKRIGIGVMAGYGINSGGLSPFIGAGVSYNFLNF